MDLITSNTTNFLKALSQNNNREWFQQNKEAYTKSHEEMIRFAENLMEGLGKYDQLVPMSGKKSLFRIYRDVRFSKDKSPYKTHWAGSLKRDTPFLRGGYFYRIEAEKAYIACGFWAPNSRDMKLIRDHISQDDKPLRKIISSKKFKDTFGSLEGEQVKTAPKGFSKDHPAIDLIRYKQLIVSKEYSKKEMNKSGFVNQMVSDYRAIRPFFDYMSDILTHDLNGIPLY